MPNPAAMILLSLVILAAVVIVWAAMMIRKLMLIVAAVLAPLAFAGATADITRAWVRRWIEFVAAMIVSKLLLVIILSVGITVLNGAGQARRPAPAGPAPSWPAGLVILLLGGLAPWVAIRMFHFAGDTLHAAHATAGQATAGARTVISAPQKVAAPSGTASRPPSGIPAAHPAAGRVKRRSDLAGLRARLPHRHPPAPAPSAGREQPGRRRLRRSPQPPPPRSSRHSRSQVPRHAVKAATSRAVAGRRESAAPTTSARHRRRRQRPSPAKPPALPRPGRSNRHAQPSNA